MKKNLKLVAFSTILLMLAGSFFSCNNEEELFLTVDETLIIATVETGIYFIPVSSNAAWTAIVENADWCTLNNSTGTGNGAIAVRVAENTDGTPRSTTVKITSGSLIKSVVINQRGALIVDKNFIAATAAAGTYFIAVSSNDDWTAVVENADWCTLNKSTGSGDDVITVNVAENTFYTIRGVIITITSGSLVKSVLVNQSAAAELIVDETPITATAAANSYVIFVHCNNEWVAVVENADWCTFNNSTGNGDGLIAVRVAENTLYTPRSATVKITSGSVTKSVVINQNAAGEDPFLIVDKISIAATVAAGTYFIAVSSNNDWTAVVENVGWCTLENNTGSGDGMITVNIAENTGYSMRCIIIKITSGSLTKIVSVSQWNAECTECPYTEHSVWKYTNANTNDIIEVTFYPSFNLMQVKTTPENLPSPPYLFYDGLDIEYHVTDNIMYWKIVDGESFPNRYWNIAYLSENEMVMTFLGNLTPFPMYTTIYHFICQTDFKGL